MPKQHAVEKVAIPFALPSIGEEEIEEIAHTLKGGWLSTGPKTMQFEEEFASYIGVQHAVGLTSCTAALHLALLAHGVGTGDEVIVPSFTFASTVNMVVNAGATPVFADIDERDYMLDAEDVERKITPRTKAVILVHYGGHPADLDTFNALAAKHGIVLIEDAAHAVGSEYRGRKVGSCGNTACFSFYATKNLSTGEGGMLTTDDSTVADFARTNRLHGMSRDAWKRYAKGGSWRYDVVSPGWKYNMFDLQAALGIHQLRKLPRFLAARERYAHLYTEALKEVPGVVVPPCAPAVRHAYHLYPIRLQDFPRDQFVERMAQEHIGTSVHFIPNHLQSFYRSLDYKEGDLPVTEQVFSEIVSLPLYPRMTEQDVERVLAVTKHILV